MDNLLIGEKDLLVRTRHRSPLFGERIQKMNGSLYRLWSPMRSKVAAAIMKGMNPENLDCRAMLYLGAANGYTCSFLSDLLPSSDIFAVEFSHVAMRDLLRTSDACKNLIPILADARFTEEYAEVGKVEVIVQDIADSQQVEILELNAKKFLAKDGLMLLSLKSQSIDSVAPPHKVYESVEKIIASFAHVEQKLILDPFEKDHAFYVLSLK